MIISATSNVGIKTFIISCQQDVVPHCANNLDYTSYNSCDLHSHKKFKLFV